MVEDAKLNVVMVSTALQGHINPMLKFAKRLIPKGVHVTLITTEVAHHRMLKLKFKDDAPTKKTNPHNSQYPQIQFEFFDDGLSIEFDRDNDKNTFVSTLRTTGSKNLSNLITNLAKKGHNYSCMVVDPLMPFAIKIAAEHNIPCALLWIQPCATFSICYRYYKNVDLFPNLDDPNEKVQFDFPGLPMLEVRDLPSDILPYSSLPGMEIMEDLCNALHKVKWVLGTSFYELEEEWVRSMALLTPIYPIGPLVSQFLLGEKETNDVSMNIWNVDDSCIGWLDNKPSSSVIYVAFGSVIVMPQKQVDIIASVLKNSNKAFLWVVKPPEKGSEQDAAELPRGFLEETKGRGLVVTWCPQEKVLMHPAVACFITHCGWNSLLETVAAGMPVIAYPKWLDQPTNAKVIVNKFQNGMTINGGEDGIASMEEMERCIKEVMEGPNTAEIKSKAMKMKEAARKALQEGGSSDKSINQFVHDLMLENSAKN